MSQPGVEPTPYPIIVGAGAATLRRALTPAAWAALECLVARSRRDRGGRAVELGVRDLAADLGVSKNTAQRALTALAAAGVVEPERRRRADGAFLPVRYRIHLPADAIDVVVPAKTGRATTPSPPADGTTVEPAQLRLLGTP